MPVTIFTEGDSDAAALEALAVRLGVDLASLDIGVLAIGGAASYRFVIPDACEQRVSFCGLYDRPELDDLAAGFGYAGIEAHTEEDLRLEGFHACHDDLEEELIRALGVAAVEQVIVAEDDGPALEALVRQPAWRDQPRKAALRRFFGSQSGRKERYARLLVDAIPLDSIPTPLSAVIQHAVEAAQPPGP